MTTAREKLFEEIVALASAPAGDTADAEIRKIMGRYRVQTKPGVQIPDGMTARDALGDRMLALWRESPSDLKERIGSNIDEFRMQTKQKPSAKPAAAGAMSKARSASKARPVPAARPAGAVSPNAVAAKAAAPAARPPRPRRLVSEPVAGGPRKRGKTRSECPKCHSMGVVLARSYAGDEYFSCIYCGWQAYKAADEHDPAASLAIRLLGHSAGEK